MWKGNANWKTRVRSRDSREGSGRQIWHYFSIQSRRSRIALAVLRRREHFEAPRRAARRRALILPLGESLHVRQTGPKLPSRRETLRSSCASYAPRRFQKADGSPVGGSSRLLRRDADGGDRPNGVAAAAQGSLGRWRSKERCGCTSRSWDPTSLECLRSRRAARPERATYYWVRGNVRTFLDVGVPTERKRGACM